MPTHTEVDREEMVALAPARRAVYSFLSTAFLEPPAEQTVWTLQSEAFLGLAGALFDEEALTTLQRNTALARDAGGGMDKDRQEFMNLFKVPGAQYVTPYESVFRDARQVAGKPVKGLLMGRSAVDVQRWYRLAAVDISQAYRDLPDHIALELNYLAHLCAKEQEFSAEGDEAKRTRCCEMERDFLAAHIVPWIGALRDKIHEKSQHPYFRALADMAVAFARRDLATLEGMLGPSTARSAPQYAEPVP